MNSPIVSICCITYNHAPFIRKALDGFLLQEPPTGVSADEPWYEILIHDDASTDGTTEIIKEYAAKYPDKIFPLYEKENQYSKGKAKEIDLYNYNRARGKYIAICEGDDYWTVPDKLRRQVDFMEANPDYSICFHLTRIFETYSGKLRPLYYDYDKPIDEDEDVTPEYFLRSQVGQPLSIVFRTEAYNFEWYKSFTHYYDTIEEFLLLREGKGRLLKFIGGQYNLHSGGVSASKPNLNRSLDACLDYVELYAYTQDPVLGVFIHDAFIWSHDLCVDNSHISEWRELMKKLRKQSVVMWYKVWLSIAKQKLRAILNNMQNKKNSKS